MQLDSVNAMNVLEMSICKFSEKYKKRDFCKCVIMNECDVLARTINGYMCCNAFMIRKV